MKPYGGKSPGSHLTCCSQHDREITKANKHRERRRAAKGIADLPKDDEDTDAFVRRTEKKS